jgi:hypothetical protein
MRGGRQQKRGGGNIGTTAGLRARRRRRRAKAKIPKKKNPQGAEGGDNAEILETILRGRGQHKMFECRGLMCAESRCSDDQEPKSGIPNGYSLSLWGLNKLAARAGETGNVNGEVI